MKDRNVRQKRSGSDKLIMFQAAFLTEANRADIPASVTLDAFLKFVHPPVETFCLPIGLHIFQAQVIVYTNLLFVGSNGFRRQIRAI
jgi:hypothetical protein